MAALVHNRFWHQPEQPSMTSVSPSRFSPRLPGTFTIEEEREADAASLDSRASLQSLRHRGRSQSIGDAPAVRNQNERTGPLSEDESSPPYSYTRNLIDLIDRSSRVVSQALALQSPTRSKSFSQESIAAMLRPVAPPSHQQDRRASNFSSSSSRSYSQDATSTPTLAMVAHEREAYMQTPRPHTASAATDANARQQMERNLARDPLPPNDNAPYAPASASHDSKSRILQWQQRRDASDATIEASDVKNRSTESASYPSDSLGRLSVTSSMHTGGGSEFGHSIRIGSESGHDWTGSGAQYGSAGARRGRKVAPPELLVVVRPPPSKQGNPLNLQIQLVTPQAGTSGSAILSGGGPRVSGESNRDELLPPKSSTSLASSNAGYSGMPSGHSGLRRSNSVSSSRSAISEASSAGFSNASGSSASRRVTPLYNLCFHSIMPTTITDAGTDDKVAKFSRKGVDIDGFGTLVPHELALGVNDLASLERKRFSSAGMSFTATSVRSGEGAGSEVHGNVESRSDFSNPQSAGTTTDSAGSGSGVQMADQVAEPPTSFDAMSPQAKDPSSDPISGIGGKLMRGFKRLTINPTINVQMSPKREANAPLSIRSSNTLESSTAPMSILARMRNSTNKMKDVNSSNEEGIDGRTREELLRIGETDSEIPQLAVGAGLRSDGSRRAQGYYWTVRKWNRRLHDDDAEHESRVPGRHEHGANPILNSVWKRFNIVNRMGGAEQHPPSHQIPVRFEWTRQDRRKRSGISATAAGSAAARATSSHAGGHAGHSRAATDIGHGASAGGRRASLRTSIDIRSMGHDGGAGQPEGASEHAADSTALRLPSAAKGNHSRPSSIYSSGTSPVRGSLDRSSAVSGGDGGEESDPEDSETTWACHLVLGPTTRIPIGSLSPTPHHPKLVAQLTVPYPLPDLSQSGLGADGAGLTREELKDIISVTALFVIVREGFGGLGRRRKGDSAFKFGAAVAQR